MYESNAFFQQNQEDRPNQKLQMNEQVGQMYLAARLKGNLGQVWSKLSGRSRQLLDLNTIEANNKVKGRHYAGIRTVRLDQIRGSEGRTDDFDINFYPLRSNSQARWMNIARAVLQAQSLPPVELIQVGGVYFVRDGHHRISVAHWIGQESIEAEVTVWQVNCEVHISDPVCSFNLAAQPA